MYEMRESWTDERLDDFRGETAQRFDAVEKRFDAVDRRFDRVDADIRELRTELNTRFDALQRTLLYVGGGLIGTLIAACAGLIAAQP